MKDQFYERHSKYIFPCVSNYYQEPLVLEKGKDNQLTDIEGNEYLDFFGGILTVGLGHCREEITEKVVEQYRTLQHCSTLYQNKPALLYAEKLAQITPGKLQKSIFTNSGSEADEHAVLLAQLATGNEEIITRRHAYSGASSLTMAMTALSPFRMGNNFGYLKFAHAPYCYRCPFDKSYPGCDLICAKDVEELIKTCTRGKIAAFLAEPIMGVGGFITPPVEYYKEVERIIRKYGGLFISDEVQTGWGRTGGKMFGIEQWGVEPDIMTMAKGAANGLPIGITIATPEVADHFKGQHISTFGGNPVSMAGALATLDYIEENNIQENCRIMGDYLRDKLNELQDKYRVIGEIRGMGLILGMEIVKDNKEPDAEMVNKLFEETKKQGLLIGKGGLYGNVIRITPALNITKEEIDEAIKKLDYAFNAAIK